MVINHLATHFLEQPIKSLRCCPLKERVHLSSLSNTKHDINALIEKLHHLENGRNVILKVCVYRNHGVCPSHRTLHACPKGMLVACVMS